MSSQGTFRETSEAGEARTEPDEPRGRRRSKRPYIVTAVLIVVAGATAGTLALNQPKAKPVANTTATSTAPVTRGDVVDTQSVDGKLTYGDSRDIPATANGTVTWLPNQGDIVKRGEPLFKVDNKPVVLMYGSLPVYRTLKEGEKGDDVKELEQNLADLGYGDGEVGSKFTSDTTDAVKSWQEDMGLSKTGTVDAGQVVFQPGEVRVSELGVPLGGRSGGGKALSVTDVTPTVHVDLDASKQNLVRTDEQVQVTMPDGNNIKGKITSVGSVAKAGANNTFTIDVDISLSTTAIGNVDQAPVSVQLETSRAKNVLSVPVEALLGLREGGFGVEVVDAKGNKHIVAIRTGAYGGGRVEVSGDGLSEGMNVEVPSS